MKLGIPDQGEKFIFDDGKEAYFNAFTEFEIITIVASLETYIENLNEFMKDVPSLRRLSPDEKKDYDMMQKTKIHAESALEKITTTIGLMEKGE